MHYERFRPITSSSRRPTPCRYIFSKVNSSICISCFFFVQSLLHLKYSTQSPSATGPVGDFRLNFCDGKEKKTMKFLCGKNWKNFLSPRQLLSVSFGFLESSRFHPTVQTKTSWSMPRVSILHIININSLSIESKTSELICIFWREKGCENCLKKKNFHQKDISLIQDDVHRIDDIRYHGNQSQSFRHQCHCRPTRNGEAIKVWVIVHKIELNTLNGDSFNIKSALHRFQTMGYIVQTQIYGQKTSIVHARHQQLARPSLPAICNICSTPNLKAPSKSLSIKVKWFSWLFPGLVNGPYEIRWTFWRVLRLAHGGRPAPDWPAQTATINIFITAKWHEPIVEWGPLCLTTSWTARQFDRLIQSTTMNCLFAAHSKSFFHSRFEEISCFSFPQPTANPLAGDSCDHTGFYSYPIRHPLPKWKIQKIMTNQKWTTTQTIGQILLDWTWVNGWCVSANEQCNLLIKR